MKSRRNTGRGKKSERKQTRKQMRSQVTGDKRTVRNVRESDPYAYFKNLSNIPSGRSVTAHMKRKARRKQDKALYDRYYRASLKMSPEDKTSRKKLLGGFFLLLVLGGVGSTIGLSNVKVDKVLMVSCSANTCRSAMVGHEANKLGFNITTCGTSKDNTWGNPMTKAARDIMSGNELTVANLHRSTECNVCQGLKGNEVFGVMAQKNKDQLIKQAIECGIEPPEIHVLGDIPELKRCKALQNDPWYESTENTCPDGNCTPALVKREQDAYRQLAVDARECVEDIVDWSKHGGPQLRLSKRELATIAEGINKKFKKKKKKKSKRRRR
tara:strand:+ start:957 stop:1934 length:978 start_codon:yes stop_codon:yes gene_type:complete